mmetsp:Transcript_10739/g.27162  ORF Transcript_10739/g.27162 Transcript_10739/m.27162 type:complete len:217 (-) Transcript_10739:635-1285(-)
MDDVSAFAILLSASARRLAACACCTLSACISCASFSSSTLRGEDPSGTRGSADWAVSNASLIGGAGAGAEGVGAGADAEGGGCTGVLTATGAATAAGVRAGGGVSAALLPAPAAAGTVAALVMSSVEMAAEPPRKYTWLFTSEADAPWPSAGCSPASSRRHSQRAVSSTGVSIVAPPAAPNPPKKYAKSPCSRVAMPCRGLTAPWTDIFSQVFVVE